MLYSIRSARTLGVSLALSACAATTAPAPSETPLRTAGAPRPAPALRPALEPRSVALEEAVPATRVASPADWVRLADWLDHAREHHPALGAGQERALAAGEQRDQVTAWSEPRFSVSQFIEPIQTRTGPQRTRLGLSQQLPARGSTARRGEAADRGRDSAAREVDLALARVERDVARAWYALAGLHAELRTTEENLALLRQIEPVVERRVEVGSPLADLLRLQSELEELESRRESLNLQRPGLGALLARAAGLDPAVAGGLAWPDLEQAWSAGVGSDPEQLTRLAEERSPLLQLAAARTEQARAELEVARIAGRTGVTLGFEYFITGNSSVPVPDSGTDPYAVSLSLPLMIKSDSYGAHTRQAMANLRAVTLDLEVQRQDLAAAVAQLAATLQGTDRDLELYEDSLIPRAERILALTTSDYRGGSADLSDLLDAQRNLLGFELAFWSARVKHGALAADLETLIHGSIQ